MTGGKTCIDYNNNIFKTLLVKFDINGSLIWSKEFNEAAYLNGLGIIYELPNEEIIITAYSDTARFSKKTQFILLDKNGTVKYKKYIGSAQAQPSNSPYIIEGCTSLNRTIDKGFVLSSWFPYLQAPHPYSIIKIDSTGCDTTEQWCTSVALDVDRLSQSTGYSFEMHPNPARELLSMKIDAPETEVFKIVITAMNGKEIKRLQMESNHRLQINTSAYSPGVYFVRISHNNLSVETRKLVIVR